MKANIDWDWVVAKAGEMAREAHSGQTRRDNETPYIEHPKRVVHVLMHWNRDTAWGVDMRRRVAIAWLHDVLEDTEFTDDDMRRADIPETVIRSVVTLTKRINETYEEFIDRIVWSNDEDARQVKLADIVANLSDSPTREQMIKYGKALVALNRNA